MSTPCKDEVLGKQVWVKFLVEGEEQFYPGRIRKFRAEQTKNGVINFAHYIEFGDDDDGWFNLDEEDKGGRLCWEQPEDQKRIKQEPSEAQDPDEQNDRRDAHSRSSAKRKADATAVSEESNSSKRAQALPKEEHIDETAAAKEEEPDETVKEEKLDESKVSEEGLEHFNSLDSRTKEWVRAIGLKNAYGMQYEGLEKIDERKYVAPGRFEQVFLLTDFLFPGEEDETYHWRLFKKHKRPGIPVRKVLRDIIKDDPDDPLVSWHKTKGQKWTPPTPSTLAGMVKVILTCE